MKNENENPPLPDSPKTLGEEMCSPNSYSLSLSFYETEMLDETEDKGPDTEEDYELLIRSPVSVQCNTLDSYLRSAGKAPVSTIVAGAGLGNLGNTCFLNAVLQCFMHTVPLLHGILSDKHSTNCDCNGGGFCLLCALRELVELSLTSTNRVVSPYKLVDNLSYFSSSFERFQQEDAHEFLQCFLDKLENCYDVKRNDSISAEHNNFVKQVFGGRLVSKLKCCSCGHCSDTYEPSIDLSLEIEDADSLLTALQSFTRVEKIEDSETKFTCEGCKEQVSIEKQLAFDQVPSVASFHLKRFKNEGLSVQKIDKHVAFPKELDLLSFTCISQANDNELKYNLYAVVVHIGPTSTSGHYYCFIRLSSDTWCKFDDSRVVQVHEDYVMSQEAYILFYAKEGTSWFSSYIESEKSCLLPSILSTSPKSVLDNVESPALQDKNSFDSSEVNNAHGSSYKNDCKIVIKESTPKYNDIETKTPAADASSDTPLQKAKEEASPSLHEKVKSSYEISKAGNSVDIDVQTLMRSPSPEIYRDDPPAPFLIPREHLKVNDRTSCKRRLEKDMIMNDFQTREACSFIKKNCPGSKAKQLLAAMRGSQSEGSVHRKKSRINGDPISNKHSIKPVRPLVR